MYIRLGNMAISWTINRGPINRALLIVALVEVTLTSEETSSPTAGELVPPQSLAHAMQAFRKSKNLFSKAG